MQSVTSPTWDVREIDLITNRRQLGTVQVDDSPGISISDYSCYASERETAWRNNFLQNTIDSHTLPKDSTKETIEIIRMLKTALIYAKEESGRVPILHIDHVYDQIISYLKGENPGCNTRNKRSKNGRRVETSEPIEGIYMLEPKIYIKGTQENLPNMLERA